MRAIVVHQYGGPEVLKFEEYPDPVPGPGEVLVRVAATHALELSRAVALDYARRARACLNGELHRDELESLTHAVVNRER